MAQNYNNWTFPSSADLLLEVLGQPYTHVECYNFLLAGRKLESVAEAVAHHSTLSALSLQFNRLGSAKAGLKFFEALSVNKSLVNVGIRNNTLGDDAAGAIAAALKVNVSITNVSLANNEIGMDGAKYLADALLVNTTLRSLDLTSNLVYDEGVRFLGNALKTNQCLTSLNLDHIFCGNAAAMSLSAALKANNGLKQLSLSDNRLGDTGFTALSSALRINQSLQMLDLSNNYTAGDDGAIALLNALGVNRSIYSLNLSLNYGIESVRKKIEAKLQQNHQHRMESYAAAVTLDAQASWSRSKLMVVGEGCAGKTATIRSLMSEKFDPEWKSTEGVDLRESKTAVGSFWRSNESKDFALGLINKLAVMKLKSTATAKEEESKKEVLVEVEEIDTEPKQEHLEEIETDIEGTTEENELIQTNLKQAYPFDRESILNALSDHGSVAVTIWDYGGQTVFHTLHHLFLTEYGVYLLVFDARKLFVSNRQSEETSLENLVFWINSIRLHAPSAPVFLVGTFCDEIGNAASFAVVRRKLETVIKKCHSQIIVSQVLFFPIDNKSNHGIESLRNSVESTIRKQDYVNMKVSVQWMRILDAMLAEKEDWLDLSVVKDISKGFGVLGASEIERMLLLFHEVGMVLYFVKTASLRDVVTMNPQWLVDAISCIIRDRYLHPFDESVSNANLEADAALLFEKALLSRDLMDLLWPAGKVDFLIDLLKSLLLLSSWNFEQQDEMFLVPSMITKQTSDFSPTGHIVSFDFDFLPNGLFERLICLCIDYSGSLENSDTPQLGLGMCKLSLGGSSGVYIEKNKNSLRAYVQDVASVQRLKTMMLSMLRKIKEEVMGEGMTFVTVVQGTVVEESVKPGTIGSRARRTLDRFVAGM